MPFQPPPNAVELPAQTADELRAAARRAADTIVSFLPGSPEAHLWKQMKVAHAPTGQTITILKRTEFRDKKPAAFKAETVLPEWLTPDIWLETFYFRRKEWDHTVDPRTAILWMKDGGAPGEATTLSVDVTKPVAGGLISSRYLVCGTNYGYLTPERYCLSAVSVNSVHDAAVAAAEKKAGSSLKGLVKAELHHSGSVLDKVEGGWRFSYMIHVTLGGWLPGSLVEATMTDQIIGFVSLWLEFTTKEFGPKA